MYVEFDIPDVKNDRASFSQYWLKYLFIKSASDRYQINALTSTFMRLIDASVTNYQSGSNKIREYWNTHTSINLDAMHQAIANFESCISNMYRATKCFQRLRRDRGQDPLAIYLNVDKANFAKDSTLKRLRVIRNDIHHIEEKVMNGRIEVGEPFSISPSGPTIQHPTQPNQQLKPSIGL